MTRPALGVMLGAMLVVSACNINLGVPLENAEAPQPLPDTATSYLALGKQYLAVGDSDQAKAAFIRSLRIEGVTAQALTGAGLAAEQQGLLKEARTLFERARLEAPDSVMAHNNLGAVLFRLGEYHAAKQAFQAAFALSSGQNRVAAHNLGLSELAIRRADADLVPFASLPHAVQRVGSGEYTLLDRAPATDGQTGEADGPSS